MFNYRSFAVVCLALFSFISSAHGQGYVGEATFPTVNYTETFYPSDPNGPGQIEVTCIGTFSQNFSDMAVRLSPPAITFTINGANTDVIAEDPALSDFCIDSQFSQPFILANVEVFENRVVGNNSSQTLFIDLGFNTDRTTLTGTVTRTTALAGQENGQVELQLGIPAGPAGVVDGISTWLRADAGIAGTDDGDPIEVWVDQSGQGNNALLNVFNQSERPPVLDASNPGAAGQPTVRFNGRTILGSGVVQGNALELDLRGLAGSDYTIFVVNARDGFALANFYIAGATFAANQNLILGYEQPGLLRQAHFVNDLDAIVPVYTGTPLWVIDTFRFDQSVGRQLYQDGILLNTDANVIPLLGNEGTTLGHFRAYLDAYWFRGDLAEVVVYDRALTDDERRRVEAELARRYGRPGDFDADGDGIDDDLDLCPLTVAGDPVDANGCVANEAVDLVVAGISTLIDSPVSDKARDKLFKAQDKLGDALVELEQGDVKKALKKIGDAVKELTKAEKEGADVANLIEQLVELARAQAQAAIDDVVAAGGDPKEVDKALKELGKAQDELAKGKPDKAIDKYAKAWDRANKA